MVRRGSFVLMIGLFQGDERIQLRFEQMKIIRSSVDESGGALNPVETVLTPTIKLSRALATRAASKRAIRMGVAWTKTFGGMKVE